MDWYDAQGNDPTLADVYQRRIETLRVIYRSTEDATKRDTQGLHPEWPKAKQNLRQAFLWAVAAIMVQAKGVVDG